MKITGITFFKFLLFQELLRIQFAAALGSQRGGPQDPRPHLRSLPVPGQATAGAGCRTAGYQGQPHLPRQVSLCLSFQNFLTT